MSMEKVKSVVSKIKDKALDVGDKIMETSMGRDVDEFYPVNEILCFGISGDNLHIHFTEASRFNYAEKEAIVIDGLKNLAIIVASNPEIDKVTASSWMVARFPRQIKKLGFEIMGPISEEFRKEHFKDEKRPVHWAMMTREEFLAKYLSND